MGAELGQLRALPSQLTEEGRHRPMQLRHLQLDGAIGSVGAEYPVERAYRDIRGLCIGAGTVEIQRNFVGSQVLRGATSSSAGWRNPLV